MPPRLLLLSASLLSLVNIVHPEVPCYFPNGRIVEEHTPCSSNGSHSMCCRPNDICLSNGLCFDPSVDRLRRESCTDSTFTSSFCSNICTNPADTYQGGFADILSCPGASPTAWYCDYNNVSRCFGDDSNTFHLPNGRFADSRIVRSILSSMTLISTVTVTVNLTSTTLSSVATKISTASPTRELSESTSPSSGSNSSSSVCSITGESHSTPDFKSGNNSTCQRGPFNAADLTGIGAGIGVPLALGIAASLFFFARERRIRRRLNVVHHNAMEHMEAMKNQLLRQQAPLNQLHEAENNPMQTVFELPH